jgi:putative tricarboxylic transport membrane protein
MKAAPGLTRSAVSLALSDAERASLEDSILQAESREQIEKAHGELAADPDLLTSTVRNVQAPTRRPRKTRKNSKENEK